MNSLNVKVITHTTMGYECRRHTHTHAHAHAHAHTHTHTHTHTQNDRFECRGYTHRMNSVNVKGGENTYNNGLRV